MDRLALAALNASMYDYESVESVREELEEFLNESVSEEELFAAFCALATDGLVAAHRVASGDGRFIHISVCPGDDPHQIWFLATSKDREVVQRQWEKNFGHRGAK